MNVEEKIIFMYEAVNGPIVQEKERSLEITISVEWNAEGQPQIIGRRELFGDLLWIKSREEVLFDYLTKDME